MSLTTAMSGHRGGIFPAAVPRGFTLIEVMIALTVISLAIGTTAWLLSSTNQQRRGVETGQQIMQLVENIRVHYGNSSDFSGLTEASAIAMGVVPAPLISAGNIRWRDGEIGLDSWNPPDSINPNYTDRNNNRLIRVEVRDIRRDQCMALAQPLVEASFMFYAVRQPGGTRVSAWNGARTVDFFDWSHAWTNELARKNFLTNLCSMPSEQSATLNLFFT